MQEQKVGPPKEIKKINETTWEIPKSYKKGMNVPARIIATKKLLDKMDPGVFDQVTNVACLPGIQKYAICHADGHWGYGFPIGGVAAFDMEEGIISPGGIGFDINCGMRMLKTNLTLKDVQPKLKELVDHLFRTVPAGVGRHSELRITNQQLKEVMDNGASWAIEEGYGWDKDKESIEDYGHLKFADSDKVSDKAMKRGIRQLGTLGSGNHYLEIQVVRDNQIFDLETAKKIGINQKDQIVVMFHTGSRGFGHQIATDYLRTFEQAMSKYNIKVNDRELACAPFRSREGQDYYKAMGCAGNFAYTNRQMILHWIREAFSKIFKEDSENLGMDLIYDNTHNLARHHKINVDGKTSNVGKSKKIRINGQTSCKK